MVGNLKHREGHCIFCPLPLPSSDMMLNLWLFGGGSGWGIVSKPRHTVFPEFLARIDVIRAVSTLSGVPEETLRGIAERSDYEQSK